MKGILQGTLGKILCWLIVSLLILPPVPLVFAQTTNITSSGLNTTITPSVNTTTVTGGTIAGSNLFHSFGNFNIGGGDIANFLNNHGTNFNNILSRVTGGNISNISGTLRVDPSFGAANLFLMNPAGIVFGSGATLDMSGAFYATTANFLEFGGGLFDLNSSASDVQQLSNLDVTAFGFTASNPKGIDILGLQSQGTTGQTVSVISGDILLKGGTLNIPGGQLNLVSVGSQGNVLAQGFDVQAFSQLGDIDISSSEIDVSGNSAGGVLIRGGKLVANDFRIFSVTQSGNSGNINIDIPDIELLNGTIRTDTKGSGQAGDIVINGNKVDIADSSLVVSTSGAGNGGTLNIQANTFNAQNTQFGSRSSGTGNGGNISLSGVVLKSNNSGFFSESSGTGGSAGAGGNIQIGGTQSSAATTIEFVNTDITSSTHSGSGGSIQIKQIQGAQAVMLQGSTFSTETAGNGVGGNIEIEANVLDISNSNVNSSTTGTGNGGEIVLQADNFFAQNSRFNSSTTEAGHGGDIHVTGNDLNISDSFFESTSLGSGTSAGNGGDIQFLGKQGGQAVSLDINNSTIDSFVNDGVGGSIQILNTQAVSIQGSTLSTETAGSGVGGIIGIEANVLDIFNSNVRSSTTGSESGGVIFLQAEKTFVQNSTFDTHTSGEGNGGSIQIAGDQVILANSIFISDSSGFGLSSGNGGDIEIVGQLGTGPGKIDIMNSQIISNTNGGSGGSINIYGALVLSTQGSTLSTETAGSGLGGDLSVEAANVEILGSSLAVLTKDSGNGGALALNSDVLNIKQSTVLSDSLGFGLLSGNGGSITISGLQGNPASSIDFRETEVSAHTVNGNGGAILLEGNEISIADASKLETKTNGGGQGGDIQVIGQFVTIDQSTIQTDTSGAGFAGKILIPDSEEVVMNSAIISAVVDATQTDTRILINANKDISLFDTNISTTLVNGPPLTPSSFNPITLSSEMLLLDDSIVETIDTVNGLGGNVSIQVDTVNQVGNSTIISSGPLAIGSFTPLQPGQFQTITPSKLFIGSQSVQAPSKFLFTDPAEIQFSSFSPQQFANAFNLIAGSADKEFKGETILLDGSNSPNKLSTTADVNAGVSGNFRFITDNLFLMNMTFESIAQSGAQSGSFLATQGYTGTNPENITIDNVTVNLKGVGTGIPGMVDLKASNLIKITDTHFDTSVVNVGSQSQINAGTVNIEGRTIELVGTGTTSTPALFDTRTTGSANAGHIALNADMGG